MTVSSRWLDRYLAGQREQVWHELRQLGRGIRDEPALALEAQRVCDEMARRARHNIEVIVGRLSGAGYRFHTNDDEQAPVVPHTPPTSAAAGQADWLLERFGEVPMTLLSWVRIVGDVWLVGTHPEWGASASADPLVIEVEGARYTEGASLRDYFEEEWEDWREAVEEDDADDVFVLPMAPDRFHKENVSGGPPYGVVLPDGCVDGLFVAETSTPFVSYLNHVFGNGGFPYGTDSPQEWRIRRALAEDLLPL